MTITMRTTILILISIFIGGSVGYSEQPDIPILYPKEKSKVGEKVNVVLDPAHDWSGVAFYQVSTEGFESPLIDPSGGRHAVQGIALKPGVNTIVIKTFAYEDEKKGKLRHLSTRTITVYSAGLFPFTPVPKEFSSEPFHSRENEEGCSGCHRLDAGPDDIAHAKPENVLCYSCHRNIPTGRHIHGPAAVWNCLACHNPDIEPYKYQFELHNPWKVSKRTQPVKPVTFSFPSSTLFRPASASLAVSKDKARDLFKDVLEHLSYYKMDHIYIEAHTDNRPVRSRRFKNNRELTIARARAVSSLLTSWKISPRRISAKGMADTLPKVPNTTKEGRELNNRIEMVIVPPGVKIKNSMNLPVLKDRERVVIDVSYSRGPEVRNVRIIERLPEGFQYIKGSSIISGISKEPVIKDNELIWNLGDRKGDFSETIIYTVKKSEKEKVPSDIRVSYRSGRKDVSRVFDPSSPVKVLSVAETCAKCHPGMLSREYKHGPADAGFCTICHNPHASPYPSWLTKGAWDLCVTCHTEMASSRHVVSGFVSGDTHPTKDRRDPSRPGKRLSCISCHNPHSAVNSDLFAHDIKRRSELCSMCHKWKWVHGK